MAVFLRQCHLKKNCHFCLKSHNWRTENFHCFQMYRQNNPKKYGGLPPLPHPPQATLVLKGVPFTYQTMYLRVPLLPPPRRQYAMSCDVFPISPWAWPLRTDALSWFSKVPQSPGNSSSSSISVYRYPIPSPAIHRWRNSGNGAKTDQREISQIAPR